MVEENILWLDQGSPRQPQCVDETGWQDKDPNLDFGSIMSDLWDLRKVTFLSVRTLRLVNKIYMMVADEMK